MKNETQVQWISGAIRKVMWILAGVLPSVVCLAGNIRESDKHVWAENAGWLNFAPTHGGVTVQENGNQGYLAGYAWAENMGWIKMGVDAGGTYANTSATNWGVNLIGSNLSGYAWSEAAGWIKFDPTDGGVTVNKTSGQFDGYAWAENVGWLDFSTLAYAAALGAPAASAATEVTTTSFAANWGAATGAVSYRLDVAFDDEFASFVDGYEDLDIGDATSYSVTGLDIGGTYYFRVRAENETGTSGNSETITVVLAQPFEITTAFLASGLTGVPYAANLEAANGVAPYTWDILHSIPSAWGNNDFGQATVPGGLGNVTALAGGLYHSLALKPDGTVAAWGNNDFGQATVPGGLGNVVAVSAGWYHSLVLHSNGTVSAWGRNEQGATNVPTGLSGVVAIAAGGWHNLALKSDGTVVAWGWDIYGQTTVPAGLSNVVAIAAGGYDSLALKADGTVVAWGKYYTGSGYGTVTVPAGLSNVVAVAAAWEHVLALKADGTVVAWGRDGYGETTVPTGLSGVVAIAAGMWHSLALKSDGTVVAWGSSTYGLCNVPAGLSNVTAIAATGYHSLALRSEATGLPDGLSCSADGVISGTPTAIGTSVATFIVQDSLGATARKALEFVIESGATIPAAPAAEEASDVTTDSFTANWSASEGATTYRLDLATDAEFTSFVEGHEDLDVGDVTSYSVTGLSAGSTYYYRVRAENEAGASDNSETIEVELPTPVLTISTRTFPAGMAGEEYSAHLAAINGMEPYAWSIGTADNYLTGWGYDEFGQADRPVAKISNTVAIAAGDNNSLAIQSDATVVAWGFKVPGQDNTMTMLTDVVAVAAGANHNLALKSDGTVVAWGYNDSGQCDVPSELERAVAIASGGYHNLGLTPEGGVVAWGGNDYGECDVPEGLTNVVAISSGFYFNIALKSDGTVAAWGHNNYGQCNVPEGLTDIMAIAAGGYQSLVLKSDGTVAAWGNNENGQCNVPEGLTGVVAIASGALHCLALKSDGTVVAWGNVNDDVGQCSVPVGLTDVVAIAASGFHSLALKSDGTIVAWGDNSCGQSTVPAAEPFIPVAVVCGEAYTLALTSTGTVMAWGYDGSRQSDVPEGLTGVDMVAAGSVHALAKRTDGTLVAWGNNDYGQCDVPEGLGDVTVVAAGSMHSVALTTSGEVIAWGDNSYGQCDEPEGLTNVMAISAGAIHNLALISDGTVVAWGYNGNGECDVPEGLTNIVAIAAGSYHNLALTAEGEVVAWGNNDNGLCDVPEGLTDVVAISAGGSFSLALKSDGALVVWGGDNENGECNVPAELSGVTAISSGSCAYHIQVVRAGTSELPEGLSLSEDGELSGTPIAASSGMVRFMVQDDLGAIAAKDLELTINSLPAAPVADEATDITTGEFSANWETVDGANSYRLDVATDDAFTSFVDGYEDLDVGDTTSYSVTGRSAGSTYYYRVRVVNDIGTSVNSETIIVSTIPMAPVVQAATNVTVTGFSANWEAVDGATSYRLEVATDEEVTSFVEGYEDLDVGDATSYSVVELVAGGTYYYRVRAQNSGGISEYSDTLNVWTLPPAPMALAATNVTATSFFANWRPILVDITSYRLDVATDASFSNYVAGYSNNAAVSTRTKSVTGLTANVTYYYRVRAQNTSGAGNNSETITVLSGPAAPVAQAAGDVTPTSCTANWLVSAGATNYYLDISKSSSFPANNYVAGYSNLSVGNETTFAATNLPWSFNTFYYRVRAQGNGGGMSTNSNTITVQTPPVAPTTVAATNITATTFWANRSFMIGPTNYILDVSSDPLFGEANYVAGYSNQSMGNVRTYSVTGLTANTTYYYRMRGQNAGGYSTNSDTITVTTFILTPEAQAATDITTNSFRANWSASSGATNYFLDVWSGPFPYYNNRLIGNTTSCVVTGLTAHVTFYYRVRAQNSAGTTTNSETITVRTAKSDQAIDFPAIEDQITTSTVELSATVSSGLDVTFAVLSGPATLDGTTLTFTDAGEVTIVASQAGNDDWNAAPDVTNTFNVVPPLEITTESLPAGTVGLEYSANLDAMNGIAPYAWSISSPLVGWGYDDFNQASLPLAKFSNAVAIAAGDMNSLALQSDGTVVAWGFNVLGQNDSMTNLDDVIAVAAGGNHSLALESDGTVVASGENDYGQSDVPAELGEAVAIAAGGLHSLALASDGTVVAWGYDDYGQCDVPEDATDVAAIAAGLYHSLVLKSDGTLVAWGFNDYGQGDVPEGLTDVVAISAGACHNLVLKSDGTVVAWGYNTFGQCDVPAGLTDVVAVAAGGYHSLALKSDGTVVAWGDNEYGQCNVPEGLTDVVAIAGGGYHSLALKSDGTVVAWGYNSCNQAAVPAADSFTPVAVSCGEVHTLALTSTGTVMAWGYDEHGQTDVPEGLTDVEAIAAGEYHSMALKSDGTVAAWGYNEYGQCDIPEGLTDVTSIAAGFMHSMALKSDGTMVAWGNNENGQCDIPEGLADVVAIAAGGYYSMALKSNGTMVAWGNNEYGQCDIPEGLTDVVAIATGDAHSLALQSDGTVVAWGYNEYGQCDVPEGLTDVVAISAGGYFSLALKSDGTVVVWGGNDYGECDVPVGLSGVTTISSGSCAAHIQVICSGSGPLPDGLSLSADGTISGTPTVAGTNMVRFVVQDDRGTVVTKELEITIDAAILDAPVADEATDVTAGGFSANWEAVDGATGYRLDVATDDAFTSYVDGYEELDVGDVTSYPVAGLDAGGTYYYRVRAVNETGTSDNSETIAVSTILMAPVADEASDVTTNSFSANWEAVDGATGYRLDVATNSVFTSFVEGYEDLDVGDVTANAVIGLSAGNTYYYRVRAVNNDGPSGNSGTVRVTTAAVAVYFDVAQAPDHATSLAPTYALGAQTFVTASSLHVHGVSPSYDSDIEGPGDFIFTGWTVKEQPVEYTKYFEFSITAKSSVVTFNHLKYTFFGGLWSNMGGPRGVIVQASRDGFVSNIVTVRSGGWNVQLTSPGTACPNDFVDNLSGWAPLNPGKSVTFRFYAVYADYGHIPGGFWNKSTNDFNPTLEIDGTIVSDTTPPEIIGCGNIRTNAIDASGAIVNYSVTVQDDTDPSPTVTYEPVSGSRFPVGDTPVMVTAWDNLGNTNTCQFIVTVAKAGQAITFPAIGNKLDVDTVNLSATASSGLPVSYAVASGPAVINGTTLTFTGAGVVSIVASQGGNGNWNAAPDVTNTFTVTLLALAVEMNRSAVNVREGGEGRFFVRLNRNPGRSVVVNIARSAGDANVTVKSGAGRSFKSSNWDVWQAVVLAAAADANASNETATFRISITGAEDQFVTATALDSDIGENLARPASGSALTGVRAYQLAQVVDGVHTSSAAYGYTIWTNDPPGTMTLDLRGATTLSRVRLLNWDWTYRVNRYRLEASADGAVWTDLAPEADEMDRQGWDDWAVTGDPVRYVRFTGLSGSANQCVVISELEVYGKPEPLPALEVSKAAVNVREAGEGRFFVRLAAAPAANVTVTVARSSGDTNLTVTGGAVRVFKPANWDVWQAVTLSAGADANADNETATFRVSATGYADTVMTVTALDGDLGENLARVAGTTIKGWRAMQVANAVDGVHTSSANYAYTIWTNVPPGMLTVDLKSQKNLTRVRLLNWDWTYRVNRYRLEASADGATWTDLAVDAHETDRQGWDDWAVSAAGVRYVRFTGLNSSANQCAALSELEIYGEAPLLMRRSAAVKETVESTSEPVSVLTSDGPEDETGWAAVDGNPATAWTGQKAGGGYLVVEYAPALTLKALEVDLAEGSPANIEYLYSQDAEEWLPLPAGLETNPVSLNYLWLVFPDNGMEAGPQVQEIRPNP